MKKEKKVKSVNNDSMQLSIKELNMMSEESITLLNKLDSLVTILSDRSQINRTNEEDREYKIEFYETVTKLEKNINTLRTNLLEFHTRSENFKIEDIILKYNSLAEKIKQNNITVDINQIVQNKIQNKDLSLEETEELVNQMVNELQKSQENNPNGAKVLKIKVPTGGLIQGIVNVFITIIFNLLLFVSLSGLFKWCKYDTISDLILFTLYFSIIEGFLKFIILTVFQKYLIKTLGLILYIPVIIALIITSLYPVLLVISNYYIYFLVVILVTLIRKFIAGYVLEKIIGSKIKKVSKSGNKRK